ncbi:MAG: hypothetical protein KGJ90_04185 [Patescibacteria group bacterium]|nr:hypothetical protein [Patescibacteria group bacterium]
MKDNLFTGEEARIRLVAGVNKVAQAVAQTMGTAGRNSLIKEIEDPFYFPTNDGWKIANSIKLADPIEEMGRCILLESINRANRESGDGSSTTCILTAKLLEEGIELEKAGKFPAMEIKRRMDAFIPVVVDKIKKQSKKITVSEVKTVAATSAEDEEIGALIQEIYEKIGPTGVIHWEAGKTPKDAYEIRTGIKIEQSGYASRYMCDLDEHGDLSSTVKMENPSILLYRGRITSPDAFDKIMQEIYEKNIENIVVFCDDIEAAAINSFVTAKLIQAKAGRKFSLVAIKVPIIFGDEWWEDLRIATGGDIMGNHMTALSSLEKATLANLGTIRNLIATKDDVYLDGVANVAAFDAHVNSLREKGDDESLQRAERLNTMAARYFVGGYSPNAIAYRRMKVEDAINSASCALTEGIVAGGGVAMFHAAKEILDEQDEISKVIAGALFRPFLQIMENGGFEADKKITHLDLKNPAIGINSKTGKAVDMFEAGIVDATAVLINAVKNAIGVTSTILTIGNVITFPDREVAYPQASIFGQ